MWKQHINAEMVMLWLLKIRVLLLLLFLSLLLLFIIIMLNLQCGQLKILGSTECLDNLRQRGGKESIKL